MPEEGNRDEARGIMGVDNVGAIMGNVAFRQDEIGRE